MRLSLFRHATVSTELGKPEAERRLQNCPLAQSVSVGAVCFVGGAIRELLIRLLVLFIVYDAISIVQRVLFHHHGGSTRQNFIGSKINHLLSNNDALLRRRDDDVDDSTVIRWRFQFLNIFFCYNYYMFCLSVPKDI